MARGVRNFLLERALTLPNAGADDFAGGRSSPSDAETGHLKVIKDSALRARLIDAGLAEGLQSPKGPQRIASIIRVYPEADAPPRSNGTHREPQRQQRQQRPGRPAQAPAAAPRGLPTIDAMATLIGRLREVEAQVGREFVARVDERIDELKQRIAAVDNAELDAAHRELGSALDEKRALATHARAEAFRRVENDVDFPERVHLRVLARP